MTELKKRVFYVGAGQHMDLTVSLRDKAMVRHIVRGKLRGLSPHIQYLLNISGTGDRSQIKMRCLEILIALQSVIPFLKKEDIRNTMKLDEYSLMHLSHDGGIYELITTIRNTLAHPIQGNGYFHPATKISKKTSIIFYYLLGREPLFKYPSKYSQSEIKHDIRFGCGYHRISIMCHIIPFIDFALLALEGNDVLIGTEPIKASINFESLPVE